MRLREWLAVMFASPEVTGRTRRRDLLITMAFAAAVGGWLFAYKLKSYYGLATTSDLFETEQLATSWLHGRFLVDNCFGHILAIHTYLFTPVLAVLALPFGAPGLLAAAGLAMAAGLVATVKILRLFSVPFGVALVYALTVTTMPLVVHFYQDAVYGFHVELLLPAMGLWLAYFVLGRNWTGSVLMSLAVLSVKEDAPLVAMAVGAMAFCEHAIRSANPGSGRERQSWRRRVNLPALAVVIIGAAALPILLHVIRANTSVAGYGGGFERLRVVGGFKVTSGSTLVAFFLGHWADWLRSPAVSTWLGLAVSATLGLVALRPHALVVGLPLSVISWLMVDDLLWPPRFAISLTFFLMVGILAFASVWQIFRRAALSGFKGRIAAAAVVVLAAFGVVRGFQAQLTAAPDAREVYALNPKLPYSPEDMARAEALFSIYRREGKPNEPVVAVSYLFRYAEGRDLYWWNRMENRPAPVWILWDDVSNPVGDRTSHYDLLGRSGRFSLHKKR